MSAWPKHVADALALMSLSPPQAEAVLDRFASAWGGLDYASLTRALHDSQDEEERLFAILALGGLGDERAKSELLPVLESDHALERWASALSLGRMRERQAFPVLCSMLSDYLLMSWEVEDTAYYDGWLLAAVDLAVAWDDPAAVPALRRALQRTIIDKAVSYKSGDALPTANVSAWHATAYKRYADRLVYALGRLGAFGALTELYFPTDLDEDAAKDLDGWRVHLLVGHLHRRYPHERGTHWDDRPQLRDEVRHLLATYFGLDSGDIDEAMEEYGDSMLGRESEMEHLDRQNPA